MGKKKRSLDRFRFIHVSHPEGFKDKEVQHKIRRHVMGTVGHLRLKPPRNPTISVNIPPNMTDVADQHQQWLLEPCQQYMAPLLSVSDIYPVEANLRARQLIHFMQVAGNLHFIPFRYESYWLATTDPAAFYLYLANASFLHSHITQQDSSSESERYLGICLNQAIGRLEKEAPRVSPGLMLTILGLACHDTHLGNWNRRAVHLDGLERAVKVYGGLEGLDHMLSLLIFWFDILESSARDSTPRYAVPKHLVVEPISQGKISSSLTDIIERLRLSLNHEIAGALQKLGFLVDFIGPKPRDDEVWKSSSRAASLITPISHALLSMPRGLFDRNDSISSNYLIELVRLALLIILARLKQDFSFPSDELASLQDRFILILLRHSGSEFPELELWCVAYVALIDQANRETYVRYIEDLAKKLGIQGSNKVLRMVRNIIFVDQILLLDIEAFALSLDMVQKNTSLEQGSA